ncbi:uncharacterized protein V6R79_012226 [Siganus canaliculatus]
MIFKASPIGLIFLQIFITDLFAVMCNHKHRERLLCISSSGGKSRKAKGLKPNKVFRCLTKVNPGSSNPITAGNSITDRDLIVFLLLRRKDGRPALYHMIEGQLGLGEDRIYVFAPSLLSNSQLTEVTQIRAGDSYSAAVTAGGELLLWGQIPCASRVTGHPGLKRLWTPQLVSLADGKVCDVACGTWHMMVLAWSGEKNRECAHPKNAGRLRDFVSNPLPTERTEKENRLQDSKQVPDSRLLQGLGGPDGSNQHEKDEERKIYLFDRIGPKISKQPQHLTMSPTPTKTSWDMYRSFDYEIQTSSSSSNPRPEVTPTVTPAVTPTAPSESIRYCPTHGKVVSSFGASRKNL